MSVKFLKSWSNAASKSVLENGRMFKLAIHKVRLRYGSKLKFKYTVHD